MVASNSTVARRPLLAEPADYLIILLILGVALITIGTWATGQLAGLLTHARWPPVAFGRSFAVARELPHHLDNPKLAWPRTAQADLPGRAGFAVSGALVLSGLVALAVAVFRLANRGRSVRGFASTAQLDRAMSARAVVRRGATVRPSLRGAKIRPPDVAVLLGRAVSGTLLWAVVESSVIVLAAPRQGKTSQVVIPWLRSWNGPALVTSIRPDVLTNTVLLRRSRGPVLVMAPTGMVDWPDQVQWSPTSGCEDFGKAMERADVMVTVGKSETSTDSSGAGYFGLTATSLLAAWLHTAALTGRTMAHVLEWGFNASLDESVKLLAKAPGAEPGIAKMLDSLYRNPSETRSNLFTTVQTALTPLFSSAAKRTFVPDEGDGLDIEQWLRAGGTIYLLVKDKQAKALAPLTSAFVDEVIETATRIANESPGGRLDPPLGLLLDEVANVSPLPHLPELISFAGGTGIFVLAILQSQAQARKCWGIDGAEMLWGSATIKVALGGLSGKELDAFSDLAGTYREFLTTYQAGPHGTTVQTTLQDRKTLTPEEIRVLDELDREALVIHATTPAVKVRMERHYEGPDRDAYAESVAWADNYRRGKTV
ncbi:TraM recognition domain-containing protein [Streptomyces sp. NPDC008317]|uniref:type IV secretory system conjugative DNA transfer family protein n=1 Tax=Streptomyces sp. NPDC008317 TaxID=3364827 RepID=UPI0036E1DCC2